MKNQQIVYNDFNGKVEFNEVDTNATSELTNNPQLKAWKSSEAYLFSNGSEASPKIIVAKRTIWVYHMATAGGMVTGTRLSGTGGEYYFKEGNRSYEIEQEHINTL